MKRKKCVIKTNDRQISLRKEVEYWLQGYRLEFVCIDLRKRILISVSRGDKYTCLFGVVISMLWMETWLIYPSNEVLNKKGGDKKNIV